MCNNVVAGAITPYVTGFGGVALGAWLAYLFGIKLAQNNHTNAINLLKRQEAHKAFLVLEASFIPAIRSLQRNGNDRGTIIPGLFNQQEIAMRSFVWHLTGESRTDFEKKWNEYEKWQNKYNEQESFSEKGGLLQMGGSNREPLIQMMENIIEDAKKY